MWMSSSIVLVALTFVLIAFVAGAICAWMVRLLGDGAPIATVQAVTQRDAARAERAEAAEPAERPAPRPSGRLVHT